jgi:hypothetical protein
MTSPPETTDTTPATPPASQPKPTKKSNVGKRAGHVAPAGKKVGKKAIAAKKPPPGRTKVRVTKPEVRDGSKTARILDLLKRRGGATTKELLKTTGWQPHSLRGFLSGAVGKKMGLIVTSVKGEDGRAHTPPGPNSRLPRSFAPPDSRSAALRRLGGGCRRGKKLPQSRHSSTPSGSSSSRSGLRGVAVR